MSSWRHYSDFLTAENNVMHALYLDYYITVDYVLNLRQDNLYAVGQ